MNDPFARCVNGHPNPGNNSFCSDCGAAMVEQDAPGGGSGGGLPGPPVDHRWEPSSPPGLIPPIPSPVVATPTSKRDLNRAVVIGVVSVAVVLVAVVVVVIAAAGPSSSSTGHARTPAHHPATTRTSSTPATSLPSVSTTTFPQTPGTTSTSLIPTGYYSTYSLFPDVVVEAGPAVSPNSPFGPPPGRPGATQARLVCTALGPPVQADGAKSQVWDYTNLGWIADVYVMTGQTAAAAGACGGTPADPTPTAAWPSPTAGPFPLVGDGSTVNVYADPRLQASVTQSLPEATFVTLACSVVTGVTVQAPAVIHGEGSNDQWDRITQPVSGWVPDSWVTSDSNGSVAPRC